MTYSEILFSLRNERSFTGDDARILANTLIRLSELFVGLRLGSSIGGVDEISTGAMETRPAKRDTRCWDERQRGRGEEGE